VQSHSVDPSQPQGLGDQTARGFAWLGVQSAVEKIVSGLGVVALAWVLGPEPFKLVGLTYTITVFATLVQSAGLREVLQHRQRRLTTWSTPGFWLSLASGLFSTGLVVATAPLAARFYGEPKIIPLLLVSSIVLPLSSLAIVPEAIIRSRMQFRLIAVVGSLTIVGQLVLSVGFALMGLGAMSIILPQPLLALLRLLVYWQVAQPLIRHGPRPRRWKYLLADSSAALLGSVALTLTYQGGQIVLGRLHPATAAAGIYYFSVVLADQSVRVLVNNLAHVLLPAISKIQTDRARLWPAFLNATGLMLLVGIPMLVLQAILAAPLIRLVFSDQWLQAIGVFSALSLAAIGRLAFGPSEAMLLARGHFRTYLALTVVFSTTFLGAVVVAAKYAPRAEAAVWAAIAGGVCLFAMGPFALRLALGDSELGWREVGALYRWPVVCTVAACSPAAVMVFVMPPTTRGDILTIVLGSAMAVVIYVGLIRRVAPAAWNQLAIRLSAIAPTRLRRAVLLMLPLMPKRDAPASSRLKH